MVSNGAAMIFEDSARIAEFDREEDALLFLSAALPGTERGMNAEFKRWVMMEGLEFIDAEELFHEVAAVEAHSKAEVEDQSRRMNWLGEFIMRWEGVSRAKGEAFYNAPVVAAKTEEQRRDAVEMAARFDARDCADRVDAGA